MKTVVDITLRELDDNDLVEAARVVSRGMRDNPANVRAFATEDAVKRTRSLERFFGPVLRSLRQRGVIMAAFRDGVMIGVCGMARPGRCQPTLMQKASIVPSVIYGNPLGTAIRVLRWTGEWARRDPAETHWHLGPVAVDAHLHGQGIGGAMLGAFCSRMDQAHSVSYLETDKWENVFFYRKFGFRVIGEGKVLGILNWFMSRRPQETTVTSTTSFVGALDRIERK